MLQDSDEHLIEDLIALHILIVNRYSSKVIPGEYTWARARLTKSPNLPSKITRGLVPCPGILPTGLPVLGVPMAIAMMGVFS